MATKICEFVVNSVKSEKGQNLNARMCELNKKNEWLRQH